jgi:sugar lactone lactonase YvrE
MMGQRTCENYRLRMLRFAELVLTLWLARRAGIYAFDVIYRGDDNDPFLTGKRLFARPLKGIAKGLICDQEGNVFAACGDGVEIWDAAGCLNGVITTPSERTFRNLFYNL